MLALLQLLLPDVASHQGVTVLIHAMPEVLAGSTNAGTTAVLQLPVVYIAPLLHDPSTSVQLYYRGGELMVNQLQKASDRLGQPPQISGVFYCSGECFQQLLPTNDPLHPDDAGLLQELLMALRANDADGYKSWLALGIEELGRDVAGEIESEWLVPLLVEEERDRLMAWQLGVSL